MKKKRIIILVVSILIIVVMLVVFGSTYAYFIASDESNNQTFTTGTLAVDYGKKTNVINLENMYPMTDLQGLNLEAHEFTVTNNGDIKAQY